MLREDLDRACLFESFKSWKEIPRSDLNVRHFWTAKENERGDLNVSVPKNGIATVRHEFNFTREWDPWLGHVQR